MAQRWHDDTLSKTRTVVPEAPHTLATWTAAWLPDSHLTPGAQRYTRERLRLHVFPVLGRTLLTAGLRQHRLTPGAVAAHP